MKTNKLNLGQSSASQERSASRLGGNLTKRCGELGEAAFPAKAASMGIGVAKPWGDSERYDFIIDARRTFTEGANCGVLRASEPAAEILSEVEGSSPPIV